MATQSTSSAAAGGQSPQFPATHWSMVVAASGTQSGPAKVALENLCQAYWYPLYAFVRRRGYSREDSQDLTQGYFEKLLAKGFLEKADPERGKFRTFLLTSLKNFLANEWKREKSWKRGGRFHFVSWDGEQAEERYLSQADPQLTPDALFDRAWVYALLERSMNHLQRDYEAAGKGPLFETLKGYLTGSEQAPYASLRDQLGLSEDAIKMAVMRLRKRFGGHLRSEIARTVATSEDVAEEIRHLQDLLG